MNKRELQGRMSASVEKRYKSFVSMVADREQVWMLVNKNGYVYSMMHTGSILFGL